MNNIGANAECGGTNFLDRHKVSCPSGMGIQSFYLAEKDGKMQYIYTCIEVKADTCTPKKTATTDRSANQESIFLDRQYVNTPNKDTDFLSEFQMRAVSKGYYYDYTSCSFHFEPQINLNQGEFIANADYYMIPK